MFWHFLALFCTFGTFFEKCHFSKLGQFESVWWSETLFWYSLLCSINFFECLCQCDLSFRSSDHKLSGVGAQTCGCMRSIRSSPMIWRMILVQFLTLYRMVKVLGQCDLSFRSSGHWVTCLFSDMGRLTNFSSYEVSSIEPQDLTYDSGTVYYAL